MQAVTTIGLDIAKSVFQVHGVDAAGQVQARPPAAHLSVYTWQELALWAIESNRHLDVCSLCALSPWGNTISSNAILVSIVFRDTDIRWKSRRVFPDCKTLMPRTARSNVALSMLHRG